ncbi:MAG: hypothetical protein KAU14_06115, partial [Thermoplasmata archaeon]|nr:hypothetical protein [Thermoplasmata archaeon]
EDLGLVIFVDDFDHLLRNLGNSTRERKKGNPEWFTKVFRATLESIGWLTLVVTISRGSREASRHIYSANAPFHRFFQFNEIPPVSKEEIEKRIGDVAGGSLAARIFEITHGNPLFVNLVLGYVSHGEEDVLKREVWERVFTHNDYLFKEIWNSLSPQQRKILRTIVEIMRGEYILNNIDCERFESTRFTEVQKRILEVLREFEARNADGSKKFFRFRMLCSRIPDKEPKELLIEILRMGKRKDFRDDAGMRRSASPKEVSLVTGVKISTVVAQMKTMVGKEFLISPAKGEYSIYIPMLKEWVAHRFLGLLQQRFYLFSQIARSLILYKEKDYPSLVHILPELEEVSEESGDSAVHVWILNFMGIALCELGKLKGEESWFKESFEKYKKAVEIKPDKHKAWNNWGTALAALGKLKGEE